MRNACQWSQISKLSFTKGEGDGLRDNGLQRRHKEALVTAPWLLEWPQLCPLGNGPGTS